MSDTEPGNDIETISVSADTEEFCAAVDRFRNTVEELSEAAESLEESAIYITDPYTGNTSRIEATDILDLQISIEVDVGRSDDE